MKKINDIDLWESVLVTNEKKTFPIYRFGLFSFHIFSMRSLTSMVNQSSIAIEYHCIGNLGLSIKISITLIW